MIHNNRLSEFKKAARASWEHDVRVAARTPHVANIAKTNADTVLVAAHPSVPAWLTALEENSAAWARLMIEGLIRTGNSGEFVHKVPMNTYAVTRAPRCPKPKFMDLKTIAKLETASEFVCELAINKMRQQARM